MALVVFWEGRLWVSGKRGENVHGMEDVFGKRGGMGLRGWGGTGLSGGRGSGGVWGG